jgi:hypothetical protein
MFDKIIEALIDPLLDPIRPRLIDPIKARLAGLSRRQKIAALICLGIAGAVWGIAAYFPAAETAILFGYRIFQVEISPKAIPVSDESRQTLSDKSLQLARTLGSLLNGYEDQAWTRAQIIVALTNNPSSSLRKIDAPTAVLLFETKLSTACGCWKKYPMPQYPPHIAISAWVTWALSALNIYHPRAIEFLLSNQNADGSWPMFAGAKEERFSSSYATSLSVVAIHEQMKLATDTNVQARLKSAVESGMNWLIGHGDLKKAQWADYPAWPDANAQERFIGISGLVLHVLHRVEAPNLVQLDRAWLENLPTDIPAAKHGEASNKTITIGPDAQNYTDDLRYYGLPWAIIGTVDAYANGGLRGRSSAAEWFQRAVTADSKLYEVTGANNDDWIAAEILLALDEYEERLSLQNSTATAQPARRGRRITRPP